MPLSWSVHGSGGEDAVINVGVSGPGVAIAALEAPRLHGRVAEKIKRATHSRLPRAQAKLMSRGASRRLGVEKAS